MNSELDSIRLQSNNPIKREKIVEIGKPSDYYMNLKDGKPIDRGDESLLMDPPVQHSDPYFWVRSDDRSDEDVLDLLTQFNQKFTNHMSIPDIKTIESKLFNSMKDLVAGDEVGHPKRFYNTNYVDYTRMEDGKGHPIYCRRNVVTEEERILLDINEFVKTVENPDVCDIESVTTSYDCKYLSYAVNLTGDEKYDLHLLDLETGKKLEHNIPNLIFAFYMWGPDSNSIFYLGYDQSERPHQIWVYDMISKRSTLLYEETDSLYDAEVSMSKTFNYIFISSSAMDTCDVRFAKCDGRAYMDPNNYTLIRQRESNIKYFVDSIDHQSISTDSETEFFVIRTNVDSATNFKVCYAIPENPNVWMDLIPHSDDRYITSIDTISNYLLIDYREGGYARVGYHSFSSDTGITPIQITGDLVGIQTQDLNSVPSTISFLDDYNTPYNSNEVYISYESMIHPTKIIKVVLESNRTLCSVVWEKTVPNYDPTRYESRIVEVESSTDPNVKIPVSIIYKIGEFDPDHPSPRPFLLYGYGSYGINVDTPFNNRIIPLVDRSFVYAIAHIRGSSTKGYGWYTSGKMENKQNTFTDFADCAKYLCFNGYTEPDLLSIEGRSAGGLIMGAMVTQEPKLFNTVVMGVPFVDVLVTMCDSTIPLTTGEWVEWGNPNYKTNYEWMSRYSPMDHLDKSEYPNTYISCGLNDPRVQYWEPVKFHLRLLENSTDENTHLIKVDMDKGHFSNTDRYSMLKEFAEQYAFVVHNTMKAMP